MPSQAHNYAPDTLHKEDYRQHSRYGYPDSAKRSSKKRKRRSRLPKNLAVALLVILLSLVTLLFLGNKTAFWSEEHVSTPQTEWQQGIMPYLYQNDEQWARHPYAETSFAESGCGPISLTMVYIFLTGDRSILPTDVADMAEAAGYSSREGTYWEFMIAGAAELGLFSEQIILDETTVKGHLDSGRPIICIMGEGDFTTTGHFIVLSSITEDGRIVIRDSNSAERSSKTWSLDTIMQQYSNAWVYWI